MVDKYEYKNLSDKSKRTAAKELNENILQINAHITSIRRWVTSMPHLNCPTDSDFLLKFLRIAKFDHKRAQKRLDNFCTIRSSARGEPKLFHQLSFEDPVIEQYLNLEFQVPLGKNDDGEMIVLFKASNWNSDQIPFAQWIVLIFMDLDVLIADEETQIHGMRSIIDLADVPGKSWLHWSDPKFLRKVNKITQDCYPMRVKGQILCHEPPFFEAIYNIVNFFLNEKMKKRTIRVKNDFSKAMDKIPGLEKILPSEYGGQGGPLKEIAERWKEQFMNYYRNGNYLSKISVDESKRPKEALNYLPESREYKGKTITLEGNFIKYDVL